jgi:beta-galactosidase/beta-glucuronidase
MKFKILLALIFAGFSVQIKAQTTYSVIKDKILTPWAEKVDPNNTLPEYPRPQLVRNNNWKNLNGLWKYAIVPVAEKNPVINQGNILVPFAVESALSGVGKYVGKDSVLWYKNTIKLSSALRKGKVLLHFGAVDWRTTVYVNDKIAGTHEGGFDPFSIDITAFLAKGDNQEIKISVWDPTSDGPQPNGKQVVKPHGIWYTPVTGIWQTVWLENVPTNYIVSTKQTPNIDNGTINISAKVNQAISGDQLKIEVLEGDNVIATEVINTEANASIKINEQKLWSPESPYLYNLRISLVRGKQVVDQVSSYFAMRKISMAKDVNGIQRMLLNNKFLFQYGPLDQGWWPDGLYTAPTDEAMRFDVDELKKMGFNMIRKHIKVEPARYYNYCDKVGMLLWQDMPSGDIGNGWDNLIGILDKGYDKKRTPESEGYYRKEWNAIMESLHNYPSIVVWVPFNEAWGQFKTKEITEWTMAKDPSRLVNSASGGNLELTGHIIDLHNYPHPAMPLPELFGKDRVLVLGEFGGLGLPLEGHTWQQKGNWGYQSFKTAKEMQTKYNTFMLRLNDLIKLGLSAAVYTQTTDVEVEINGLITYDRKVIKIPAIDLKKVHQPLYDSNLVQFK